MAVVSDVIISLGVLATFYGLLALGMNIKYGFTGLLDFGHVGFYLVGAYTAALLVIEPDAGGPDTVYVVGLDLPWIVAVLVATVLAGVVGVFVALPTLRLREDYLAITVLGIAAIFQRIVQAESWLVNGPDALRGYTPPLIDLFPVTGGSPVGAAVMAVAGGAIWAGSTWALGRAMELEFDAGTGPGVTVAGRLHAVVTFGTDRLIGFENYRGGALVAGAIAAVVGGVLSFAAQDGFLAWAVVVSVFTWLVAFVWLTRYSSGFDAVDYLTTFALGAAYMGALAPMFFLETFQLWVPLTGLAFAVVIGVTVYLYSNWQRFAARPFGYGLFTGLWFGFIWYIPLQILSDVAAANWPSVASSIFGNVVWVLSLSGDVPEIGYPRFKLFLFGTLLLVALYLSELTIDSPFGRVLRAIRNDERVVNSLGKDPFMYKIMSMAIGSALAGLAGALAAMHFQVLVFTMFAPRVTFIALLMLFLGGVGNNRAMVVGAFLFWAFQTATTQLSGFVAPGLRENIQAFRFVVMGVLFLLLLYYRPQGLMGERAAAEAGSE
ncbi:MAG: branched-chain amino acid ABC transporter permease [Halobacteriales archaeon SW_9_67_25]|jgi:ABC-type branched-subunit amino acid transport system permease subunit|nr:MAG: branched-chain amino acid ABC transporter permease [Halobacteriales archaeon SW_9_67_25]